MPPQTPDPLNPTPAPNPVPAPTPIPAPVVLPPAPAQPVAPTAPPTTASAHVDLDKIILPKKPGTPSVDSAQRINAGVLFEQERTATLPEPEKPATPVVPAQAPKPEQPLVRPLQTYQGDIESLVGEKQVSVVSIAAAEAERRGALPLDQAAPAQEGRPWIKKTLLVAGGLLLLTATGGVGFYIYSAMQPVPLSERMQAPFILVDETQTIVIQPGDQRQKIIEALVAAKHGTALSLGLVARIQPAKPGPLNDGSLVEVTATEFLQALVPEIPAQLVRTLEPQMLLGLHSFDENQALMILKADSYETAYSGMLAWEQTMYEDLTPLFARTPAVRTAPPSPITPVLPSGTTTASTTVASSTPTATTTKSVVASSTAVLPPAPTPFVSSVFVDRIVENRDARVLLNAEGDILLLWTMLDRSTIVITTNQSTLREVISRLSQASILSLPASN